MTTYLILALDCKVYKKNPLVRIFINNTCVDEFDLPHGYHDEKITLDLLDPLNSAKVKQHHIDAIHFLKIIKFQSLDKNCDVEIEIINNDSNYTNGFMTKSTFIKIRYIFLLNQQELDKISNMHKSYSYSQNNFQKFYPIKKYYTDKLIYNIVWPNFSTFADLDFNGITNNDYTERKHIRNQGWLGGSGKLKFSAQRHMGIWRTTPRKLGICRLGPMHVIEKIVNKYMRDENIRNTC